VQRWRPASLQHQQDGRIHRLSGQTMGTHWSLRLANPDYLPTEPVQALLEQVFEDVIAQMSNWEADSLITRFNRSRPGETHVVPAEFAHVLEAALHWAGYPARPWIPPWGRWSRCGGSGRARTRCSRIQGRHRPARRSSAC
jgi:thiamine biosynthesis lipoprotein